MGVVDIFSVDGGTITPDTAQTVIWTAPATAGVAWIRVDVTREDSAKADQSSIRGCSHAVAGDVRHHRTPFSVRSPTNR